VVANHKYNYKEIKMSADFDVVEWNQNLLFPSFINDGNKGSTKICYHWHKEIVFVRQGIIKTGVNDESYG